MGELVVNIVRSRASEIAHDINGLSHCLVVLARRLSAEKCDGCPEELDQITEIAQRISGICLSELIDVSIASQHNHHSLDDILMEIERLLKLTRKDCMPPIAFEAMLCEPLDFRVDSTALYRIIYNLCVNAAAAVRDRKHAEITLLVRQDGDDVVLKVTDNASGLPRNVEKWFATPCEGASRDNSLVGTGLSNVTRLVDTIGGKLDLETTSSAGTSILVTFPRHQPLPAKEAADAVLSTFKKVGLVMPATVT